MKANELVKSPRKGENSTTPAKDPPAMSLTVILTGALAKPFAEQVVKSVFQKASNAVHGKLDDRKIKAHAKALNERIIELRKVKTLWQIDKSIDILDFYYPLSVQFGKSSFKILKSMDDFNDNLGIVIEGTVGQGKSTFLRQFSNLEYFNSKRVPVFIELGRIRQNVNLGKLIDSEIMQLGFKVENSFKTLANEGCITLMLDAFDEIPAALTSEVLLDIEALRRLHPLLRIIVTSRDGRAISKSVLFSTYKLAQLQSNEYKNVIARLSPSEEFQANLIEGIERAGDVVKRLLTTPLMVVLLCIKYKAEHTVPESVNAFYSSLFLTLAKRHDGTKPGTQRTMEANLNEMQLLEGFNALCFEVKKKQLGAQEKLLDDRLMYSCSKSALSTQKINCDPQSFLNDIVNVTCLLLNEGGEYKFIHKSVMEFHVAQYIAEQEDEAISRFYLKMQDQILYWRQELIFLAELDKYRFYKYFLSITLRQILESSKNEQSVIGIIYGTCEIHIDENHSRILMTSTIGHKNSLTYETFIHGQRRNIKDHVLFEFILSKPFIDNLALALKDDSCKIPTRTSKIGSTNTIVVRLSDVIDYSNKNQKTSLFAIIERFSKRIHNEITAKQSEVDLFIKSRQDAALQFDF